nr:hypothetical protein [Tanacetum cinerariifolium]
MMNRWKAKLLFVGGCLSLIKAVLASKAMGSLGIGSIFALNVSLLFEWVWRFRTTSNSLWVNVIKDIHGHDGGIESGRAGKLSHSPWNSIIRTVSHLQAKVIDLFALCGRSVGDGNSISFWGDNWFAQRINIEDWSFVLRRPPRCGVEWNQLDELIQVTRDVVHSADGWNWELDTTGYLVASARIHIDEHTLNGTFTSTRWLRCIPIKVNVFIWRLRLDKLLTLVSNITEWFSWLDDAHMPKSSRIILEGIASTMMWSVWNLHNAWIFSSSKPKKANIWDSIVHYSFL